VREATAVSVGAYAIFLLVLVYRAQEAPSFSAFFEGLRSPVSLLLHLIALMMVLYHTFTWSILLRRHCPCGRERSGCPRG
jgi:fumarate reductase subunit C